ncbi:hypothetical protein Pfo_027256, partial [Paulownia fortunei]
FNLLSRNSPPPSSTTTHNPDFQQGMDLVVQHSVYQGNLPKLIPSRWMPKIGAKLVATSCVYGWVRDDDAGVGGWGWFGGCGGEETERKKKFEIELWFCFVLKWRLVAVVLLGNGKLVT